ncbi:hypothetical protein CHARACLAT_016574 [Characodon lateralis]|uniref:Uncharacterized protein n=1 Tax=Characodon lateralis TaxID=208331 RepID=A0ABU7DRP0_9TELE|nr:hypothetical protein [Characodon lateralis]
MRSSPDMVSCTRNKEQLWIMHVFSFRVNPVHKETIFFSVLSTISAGKHLFKPHVDEQPRKPSSLLPNPCQSSPLTNAIIGQERLLLANNFTTADGRGGIPNSPAAPRCP